MSSAYRERAGSAPFTPSVEGIAAIEAALAGAAASKTGLGSLSSAPGAHFTPEARAEALRMFITDLGLPAVYFEYNSVETVAKHIASMMAARELASASGRPFDVQLAQESEKSAFFAARSTITTDRTGAVVRRGEVSPSNLLERYIESKYLAQGETMGDDLSDLLAFSSDQSKGVFSLSKKTEARTTSSLHCWRLQCYRSRGVLSDGAHMRLYFLQEPDFAAAKPGSSVLEELMDPAALVSTTSELLDAYRTVVKELQDASRLAPSIVVQRITEVSSGEGRDVSGVEAGSLVESVLLVIGHRAGSTHSYFSATPDVYRWYGMYAVNKTVEVLANGVIIFAFKLRMLDFKRALAPTPSAAPAAGASDFTQDRRAVYTSGEVSLEARIADLVRDTALHFVLPRTSVSPLLMQGVLSAQEVAYAYAVWKFSFHFMNRLSGEMNALTNIIHASNTPRQAEALALVSKLRKHVQSHAFTESQILDAIFRNPSIVSWLYDQFAMRHRPRADAASPHADALTQEAAQVYLQKQLKTNEDDLAIFTAFLGFNFAVLKTNFYRTGGVALSFRLSPTFLGAEYPDKPHGIFFVVGAEFRGFHTRFADVARGGIRLIKSASPQAYTNNLAGLFDECYSLASTQQRKNKDIPEGGSKGVILLNLGHQDKTHVAFSKYVDSIMDILLPNAEIVDHLGAQEILFFGPDENTADLMDFACQHARSRGYPFWKAFTTGKSLSLGGIPHDVYGMTTRGVRAYVTGIQRKLGLNGAELTKLQTGGPDGDLGSNEIKLGIERVLAVVDGSGVLCDPEGIHREELLRLATARRMISNFDRSKLSARGFIVLVNDVDITLPDGTLVPSGVAFRNNFHLNPLVTGDFFVPCGGRPAAVNADNVDAFLFGASKDGAATAGAGDEAAAAAAASGSRKPRFKYIVEGANLFFTNEARLAIEKKGVILFKDSSANKGGVTSSSLEVLAALSLTDSEFRANMCVAGEESHEAHAHAPAFYKEYVAEVQARIDANARKEFECLWREHTTSGTAISILSDQLSVKITSLSTRIEKSDSLWNNVPLRRHVLETALPRTLCALVGGADAVLARLPENYQRALYGSALASNFIYASGLTTTEFAFFEYVDTLLHAAPKAA